MKFGVRIKFAYVNFFVQMGLHLAYLICSFPYTISP
jgi:hypothetical protein